MMRNSKQTKLWVLFLSLLTIAMISCDEILSGIDDEGSELIDSLYTGEEDSTDLSGGSDDSTWAGGGDEDSSGTGGDSIIIGFTSY